MFTSFDYDRQFIEGKFHKVDEPFNPYRRMAYHGWECPENTGASIDDIREGLLNICEKYKNESHAVQKARAVEYVLDHTRIDINEHDYFPVIYTWSREISRTTVGKWQCEVFEKIGSEITAKYNLFNESGAAAIWPDFDHVVPDWNSIFALGFVGLKARAQNYRVKLSQKAELSAEQKAYFDGIEILYSAIIRFLERLYELSLTKTHQKALLVQQSLYNLTKDAPKTTLDALMTIYLYFMISESIEHYQVRSLGNGLDFSLLPFYENDLKNGTFTREEIKELLAYFFMQWSAIGNYWGQPLYLGGTDKEGKTKINDLSYDIIDV